MNVTIEDAYATACRRLGEAEVELELFRNELNRVTAERDEAGARIVELTTAAEGGTCEHAGTIDGPAPAPPLGETRVQNC